LLPRSKSECTAVGSLTGLALSLGTSKRYYAGRPKLLIDSESLSNTLALMMLIY
jgi:hypothetical protein